MTDAATVRDELSDEALAAVGRAARHAIHLWDDGNGPGAYGVPLTVYIGRACLTAFNAYVDTILTPPGTQDAVERLRAALKKIADLRYVEDANEPFDEALDIADAALSKL